MPEIVDGLIPIASDSSLGVRARCFMPSQITAFLALTATGLLVAEQNSFIVSL